jgi:formate hydrogenlyase subunit 3/multisubunit Na+/H+ antiporter MnhD subunit
MNGSFSVVLPLALMVGGAFGITLLTMLLRLKNKVESVLATLILLAALAALIQLPVPNQSVASFYGVVDSGGILFEMDYLGVFLVSTAILVGIFISIYSGKYLSRDHRFVLYYPLILLTMSGLLGLFFSTDLFNIFLLVELTTITIGALIAFRYKREDSVKAGFKYLIMSTLGAMFMMLGIYFTYRSSGSLSLSVISAGPDLFTRIGAGCFLIGFWIKAGVVPLHTWVPDVYSKAPSAISGLLAGVMSKAMLFLAPTLCLQLGMSSTELGLFYILFAFMNMLLGSIRSLKQNNLRRFLAYSSIAQTGYLMFALGISFLYRLEAAFSAALFLFVSVAMMKCLAFLAMGIYEYYLYSSDVEALKGVYRCMSLPAVTASIALAGLAGIPLLAGFNGKWLVFSAVLTLSEPLAFVGLAVFLLSSVIGLGGYLPMIAIQFQSSGAERFDRITYTRDGISLWMVLPIIGLAALVVLLGIFPSPWLRLIDRIMDWVTVL